MEKSAGRQVEAYRLRYEEGKSYKEVAQLLQYKSEGAAYNAVQGGLNWLRQERSETIEQARDKAITRTRQMIKDLYDRLEKPSKSYVMDKDQKIKTVHIDENGDLPIYDRIIKLEQHLAKLEGTIQDLNQTNIQVNTQINNHEAALKELE